MAVNLSPVGGVAAQFFTNEGVPLSGGMIYTYLAGTSTPALTYTNSLGGIPWSNPIVLDSAGRVSGSGEIWLTDGINYKFVLKDANATLIATYDNISGINSNFIAYTNSQEIQTATAGQTVFTLTTMQYQPGTNSLSVFVDGVNQYGPGAQYSYIETDSSTITFNAGLHVGAEVKFTSTQQQGAGAVSASQVSFTGFNGSVGNVQDLAGNDGSDWIGFEPIGTGAIARSAQTKMREVVSVTDYGAVGDGTGDLGIALQAAHNALGPDGGQILIPAASNYYLMTTSVTFTKPIRLVGEGWFSSEIATDVNGITLIATTSKLDVENTSWTALGAAIATCTFILHQPTSANHNFSTFRNNYFSNAKYAYHSQSTNAVVIDGNVIGCGGGGGAGLWLENLINSDIGDSHITNNNISGAAGCIGVLVPSTSGINFCNNKFNGVLLHHVLINVGANPTGNFLFSNNSFEGHTDAAIKVIATTGTITKIVITGNQFSSNAVDHVVIGNNAINTVITGNTFNSASSTNGLGINVLAGAENVTITGNAFHQILTAVAAAPSQSAGITMSGNRFANDVTTFFVGDDNLSLNAPQREVSYSRFISNSSDSIYVDVCKLLGYGTVDIKVYGIVQGVGNCNYYAKYLVSGGTPTQLIVPTSTGASFDVQVATSAGYLVVSAKRATGVGSSITVFVEVTTNGQISDFRKA